MISGRPLWDFIGSNPITKTNFKKVNLLKNPVLDALLAKGEIAKYHINKLDEEGLVAPGDDGLYEMVTLTFHSGLTVSFASEKWIHITTDKFLWTESK